MGKVPKGIKGMPYTVTLLFYLHLVPKK
jgi:hypothetical protein